MTQIFVSTTTPIKAIFLSLAFRGLWCPTIAPPFHSHRPRRDNSEGCDLCGDFLPPFYIRPMFMIRFSAPFARFPPSREDISSFFSPRSFRASYSFFPRTAPRPPFDLPGVKFSGLSPLTPLAALSVWFFCFVASQNSAILFSSFV